MLDIKYKVIIYTRPNIAPYIIPLDFLSFPIKYPPTNILIEDIKIIPKGKKSSLKEVLESKTDKHKKAIRVIAIDTKKLFI